MMDELPPTEGIRALARDFTQRFTELLSGLAKQHGLYIIGGSHPVEEGGVLLNKCLVFDPDGSFVAQPKLHITPWETRSWGIVGGNELVVVTTPKVRIGVQICYDVEFPEASRYLAEEGVDILFVPYCTDDRQGYWRVRHCAQARAIENQIYIVTAGVTGHLSGVPEMNVHYGDAAVYCPSDFGFGRDGVHAITDPNGETMLVTDIDTGLLQRARANGSVTPRLDRRTDLFECRAKVKMTGRNVGRD
jgi:predicted amidohydrolase